MTATDKRIKVVYVGGSGRCGSTLLSLLFSEHPAFLDCGEIKNIWERGILEDRKCACGEAFQTCDFWHRVIEDAFGNTAGQIAGEMRDVVYRATRYRNYPRIKQASHAGHGVLEDRQIETLGKLYDAIHRHAEGKIIVDSSKLPSYARILMLLPNVDLFYVDLVRDARAVVYSWQKRMKYEPGATREMDRFGLLHAALIWKFAYMTGQDVLKELPGMVVRYEDLVTDTKATMGGLLHKIDAWTGGQLPGTEISDLSWTGTSHSLSGNPLRFRKGEGVKLDDEWRHAFRGVDKLLTCLVCGRQLRRYGYD
jgi:hypothetical protein